VDRSPGLPASPSRGGAGGRILSTRPPPVWASLDGATRCLRRGMGAGGDLTRLQVPAPWSLCAVAALPGDGGRWPTGSRRTPPEGGPDQSPQPSRRSGVIRSAPVRRPVPCPSHAGPRRRPGRPSWRGDGVARVASHGGRGPRLVDSAMSRPGPAAALGLVVAPEPVGHVLRRLRVTALGTSAGAPVADQLL